MKFVGFRQSIFAFFVFLILVTTSFAQDYRGKIQGIVTDESGGVVPGTKVVLRNEETKVENTLTTDDEGRYKFNFVEPGKYSVIAEKDGFKKVIQQGLVVQIQGDVTVDLKLAIGDVSATVTVEDTPASVQFNTSGSGLTLDNTTIDQMPVRGRNPYNIITLDPSINGGENNNGENRPYHHAYANEVDAGGGTNRSNEVQLNGVALTSSYKVAYTPSVDAVKEVTFSRSIVDSEQGFSLGGTIALNMKSGGSQFNGAAFYYKRDPRFNAFGDPTIRRTAGANETAFRGTNLSMVGGNVGGPIIKKKLFFFTSYEFWDDKRPITVLLNVPTALERAGDFSQSGITGVYNPFTSTSNASTRTQFTGNIIPQNLWDPVAVKLLALLPLPNAPGQVLNWQGSKTEQTKYWNASTRVDWNISEKLKTFFSYGQFKASPEELNPTDSALFPLNGSNRFGLNLSADVVYTLNSNTVLNFRAGYFRLTDEYANDNILLGQAGLANLWGSNTFYSSVYTTDQVYYPAIDVRSNGGDTYRFGRPGREFWQHPEGYNGSIKLNTALNEHSLKYGGEYRLNKGKAARFEPLNFTFRSELTAIRQGVSGNENLTTGSPWASFLIGALQNSSSARRVPVQEVIQKGYALYFQDDWKVTRNLTLNLGIRWEFEPGPFDVQNRISQGLDLTIPNAAVAANPLQTAFDARVVAILNGLGQKPIYNGAWQFATDERRGVWDRTPTDFLPRLGFALRLNDKSSLRVGYARYIQPSSSVRDSLGDFVDAYTGFSTITNTLNPTFSTNPANTNIALLSNPFPTSGVGINPVQQPSGQTLGIYTGLGNAVNFDKNDMKPQLNDKLTIVYQREIWNKMVFSADYFFNFGTRLPQTVDLNAVDPMFFYNNPRSAWNFNVTNPFLNYLTATVFPGQLRNLPQVAVSQLMRPYPMYQAINQTRTDLRKSSVHSLKLQIQQPSYKGLIFTFAYAINDERTKEAFDDLALYNQQFTWIPTDAARHRFTNVITWDIPIGKGKTFLGNASNVVDYILGGWRLSNSSRYYSGRLLRFTNVKLNVSGNPVLDNPTRDRWFDTSVFSAVNETAQNQLRSNPWYFPGLVGPSTFQTDATLTKGFRIGEKMKLETRLEVYNVLNNINWDNPNITLGNANFGKVTAKRGAYVGREVQYGLRFIF